MRSRIFYIYDPLCLWCYGFSPVIKRLQATFQDRLGFSVLSGGLSIGSQAVPIRQGQTHLRESTEDIARITRVPFGDAFVQGILETGDYVYDSEPPSIALRVFKELKPEEALSFASRLQSVLFYEGRSLNEADTYAALAQEYGLDKQVFLQKWHDPVYKQKTREDFQKCQAIGATGYPTVIFSDATQGLTLTRGYQPYEPIAAAVEKLLAGASSTKKP